MNTIPIVYGSSLTWRIVVTVTFDHDSFSLPSFSFSVFFLSLTTTFSGARHPIINVKSCGGHVDVEGGYGREDHTR